MSSPYLNNTIIIGCLLTYTSVILLGLDSSLTSEAVLPIICTARIWTLMAGFTLAFGSMFSKTWRVYSIFTNVKINKKVSSMWPIFFSNNRIHYQTPSYLDIISLFLTGDQGLSTIHGGRCSPFHRHRHLNDLANH